ncbi:perlucin-like protein [Asterias rubens]|uniref:perlucin-like protein n=1 Tax=Asterias rubens TaxID=7604 RepID=UPI0014557EA7|nr:perlucin-like protein [Asterias rubens]
MKTLVLLFAVAFYFVVSSCNEGLICPSEWVLLGESCYKSVMEKMTFDDAVKTCTDMSGRLAVPTSFTDNQFIFEMVNKVVGLKGKVWVGCTDREEEGKWVQLGEGGEECSFFNWYPGEPNSRDPDEDCAQMILPRNGSWYDGQCDGMCYVVCQRPAVAPTNPLLYCLQADTNGRFA